MKRRRFLFVDSSLSTVLLQSGLFFVRACDLSVVSLTIWAILRARSRRAVLLHLPCTHVYPCWKLGPQDVESCRSNPFPREPDSSLTIPTIVQRELGEVIDACSRLPHEVALILEMENVS